MRSLFKLGRAARAATMLCALAVALAAGAGSAMAATRFGSYGSEAGQFKNPVGVAANAEGDVYVSDSGNQRVDKFDGSGGFLLAWGAGVADQANELQTCTTACDPGRHSAVVGAFEFPGGVAVDNDPLSSSYGDVYVVDSYHFRVEKFDPNGRFLLMFGGHVNATTGANTCVAGETCQIGKTGTNDGEFSYWPTYGNFIAVGPGGDVYVGDQARVEIFEQSGAWKENVSLAGLSSEGRPSALAVDASGNIYVKDEGVSGVRELEPGGTEKAPQFDTGSTTVTALALDSSGDVYVGDSSGGFHVLEYDSTATELASFGSNTVVGENNGLAFSQATKDLYATAHVNGQSSSVWVLPSPPPGPLIDGESATPGLRGTVTLEAAIDPEGNEAVYHFEYVDETHYQIGGFASATSTGSVPITSGLFEDHAAAAHLTGLVPGGTYHYRLVAIDAQHHTATGADQIFEPTPPALIEGPWAANVAGTSATLAVRIDPLGASTEYRLEYGTSASYGHVLRGNIGEGMGYVLVSYHRQELEPDTTYHYRVVTASEVGTVEGSDHTFTTQLAGGELTLPDGRAWELVSPADKKGGLIGAFVGKSDAANNGDGITYAVEGTPMGEDPVGDKEFEQVLSTRSVDGWRSRDITVPQSPPKGQEATGNLIYDNGGYGLFSSDLSRAVVFAGAFTSLSSEGSEGTMYLRDSASGSYVPLFTPANVPVGIDLMSGSPGGFERRSLVSILASTPDMSHFVIKSPLVLAPGGVNNPEPLESVVTNLYEWNRGQLQLISVLPNGESVYEPGTRPYLAGTWEAEVGAAVRAMSSDGRWIAWTWGAPPDARSTEGDYNYKGLYVRDMVGKKTLRVGGIRATYQTMSSDGSRIFFLEGGDLYEFDSSSGTQIDLTIRHSAGETGAGVKEAVSDVSEDGSYVYFVASGALAPGAVGGEDNLYLLREEGGAWSTRYVATLSGKDEKSWYSPATLRGAGTGLNRVSSRVSPDGRYLAFMSERPLTGYDNTDAVSGRPDEEVYLYDAVAGRLVCASCNPTGARPIGVPDEYESNLLVDKGGTWKSESGKPLNWLAANIPSWQDEGGADSIYQPRYLSDGGRLFFNSSDALVPQDTNGLEDVYEYEPPGVGSCTRTSSTFSEQSGGCVNLISPGTSASESAFFDASESGNDVFFITSSKLVPEDYDTAYDVYDAHVCSASAPCVSAPVSPPPCTSGDSCKAAPSPQPAIFGPAPSATFSGAGNVVGAAKTGAVKARSKPKRKASIKRHAKKRRKAKRAKKSRVPGTSGKGGR